MQSPISITKFQKSARMTCEIQTLEANFDGIVIHWYQQKEGKAPERLLFFSGGKVTIESGFQANRYMVERISIQKRCVLTIKDVIPDDAATYYCAYWDPHCDRNSKIINAKKTYPQRLNHEVVTVSPPANTEILQKKHGNQIMYVCIIEKFYPELIRVTWTDEEKEITDNVVKGDTWQSTKEDEYSIASWLTVPAENKDKKYYCKYEHEEKKDSLPAQDIFFTIKLETAKTPKQFGETTEVFPGKVILSMLWSPNMHPIVREKYLNFIRCKSAQLQKVSAETCLLILLILQK
uniref:Ig-like domain-containing protein n=1 Tax=Malurus cyaneus samueli TaxID=2593467 RepID=A0A8C5T673_9PASS